jgi:hypothetical protein
MSPIIEGISHGESNEFLQALKTELKEFTTKEWEEHLDAVLIDGNSFATKAKEDLKHWTTQLVKGKLTADEFQWLVKGKKDLAEMESLNKQD